MPSRVPIFDPTSETVAQRQQAQSPLPTTTGQAVPRVPVTPGGSPTVPPTAQPTAPESLYAPQQPTIDINAMLQQMHQPTPLAPPLAPPVVPQAQPGQIANAHPDWPVNVSTSAATQPAPPGYDAAKWADPTHDSDKYHIGRALASGATVQQALPPGWTQLDDDNVQAPDGTVFDVWFDFGGANQRPQMLAVPGSGPSAPGLGGNGNGPATTSGGPPGWLGHYFGKGGAASGGPSGGAFLDPSVSDPNADPMSRLLDSGLGGLIESGGQTPFGSSIAGSLQNVIANGGVTPDVIQKLIGARESAATAQQGMLEDARAQLASQGLMSVPGVDQGPANLAVERTSQQIAPQFAGAVRDIYSHALDVSNQSFMGALTAATGMSHDQASVMLNALGQGTSRQQVLSEVALNALHENNDWNKFVASYGLDRAKLEEDIANGRLDRVIALIDEFIKGAGAANAGFIGYQ